MLSYLIAEDQSTRLYCFNRVHTIYVPKCYRNFFFIKLLFLLTIVIFTDQFFINSLEEISLLQRWNSFICIVNCELMRICQIFGSKRRLPLFWVYCAANGEVRMASDEVLSWQLQLLDCSHIVEDNFQEGFSCYIERLSALFQSFFYPEEMEFPSG